VKYLRESYVLGYSKNCSPSHPEFNCRFVRTDAQCVMLRVAAVKLILHTY